MIATGSKVYTVTSTSNALKCIDAMTGNLINMYRFTGTLVSGPIVTGDRVTIVVRRGTTNTGIVLKLPSLLQTSTFRG